MLEDKSFKRPKTNATLVLGAILVTTTMDAVFDIFDSSPASVDLVDLVLRQMMIWSRKELARGIRVSLGSSGTVRRRGNDLLVGSTCRHLLVFFGEIVGIPVLTPGCGGLHRLLFEFFRAVTEVEKNLSII